jgi:hypothetical protein
MTFLIAMLVAAAPVPPSLGTSWAEFSRKPALRLTKTTVEVGTLGYDRSRKRLDFWLRRTVTTGVDAKEQVSWTDTRTCARARPTLASIREIPVPRFAPVGSTEGAPVVLDGVGYRLRTYSDHGTLTAETNVGTPLASWIDGALKGLEGCWGEKVPERTR